MLAEIGVGRAMLLLRQHGVETMMNCGLWARDPISFKWVALDGKLTVARLYDFMGY